MHGGADDQKIDRRDQSIAGIATLLVHASLILLTSHNSGSGLGNYKGNNTGRGDGLTVYPMLLAPSAIKTTTVSPTRNPTTAAVAPQAQANNPPPTPMASTPTLNIARPINQADSNARNDTPHNNDTPSTVQMVRATASTSASASSGANSGDDLLSSYQAAIRAAVFKKWQDLSNHSYPSGCTVHLSQSPGGIVTATSAATCGLSREDQLQLEAAALMAQPMPYAGYESVFSPEMDLIL